MKIAISGKGGVGKSTVAAAIALLMAQKGKKVLAVDADPDANLASALGIPSSEQKNIVTIANNKELIEERTGAEINQYGQMFKLNPEVSDIADKYAYNFKGVSLLVLGAIKGGGAGCACAESTLLKTLVQHLVLHQNEALVMDMEAGIEHLGRSTAGSVDEMIVVVEPGQRSIDSFRRIVKMSGEIGIRRIKLVINKIHSPADEDYIRQAIPDIEVIASIPYSEKLLQADRDGISVLDVVDAELMEKFQNIAASLGEI
jgi:CO dehydrogenase maturation factor